jgi:hypothetical protein
MANVRCSRLVHAAPLIDSSVAWKLRCVMLSIPHQRWCGPEQPSTAEPFSLAERLVRRDDPNVYADDARHV